VQFSFFIKTPPATADENGAPTPMPTQPTLRAHDRIRSSFAAITVATATALLAGCAHNEPPPVVPQPTLAAVIDVPAPSTDPNALPDHDLAPPSEPVTHHVEITVDHLPSPKSFAPSASTYVFWVRANDDDAWANAAHLEPSKEAEEATFDFRQDTLFVHVTAEASADVRTPSPNVVLSAHVSSSGACAHSVDQRDVKMKVRMCR
jgi:hypothetical protein